MGGAGPQALKDQIAVLETWDARQPKNPLYLWLYNTWPLEIANRGRFYCYPGFFAKEAGRQLAYFDKLGVQGIFHCGFNGEVENYVTYQMMDDPTLDVDKLLDRYFAAYGAAARPAEGAVSLLRKRKKKVGFMRLVTIWPFPREQVRAVGRKVKKIYVPEMNLGQISREIERFVDCPVVGIPKIGGIVHTVSEIVSSVK